MKTALSATTLLSFAIAAQAANLALVAEYSGTNFFDKWDFYGDSNVGQRGPWNGVPPYDDTTNGDVFYMGKANGSSLYRVDATTGHAFLQVDNTSFVPYDQKRDSIRITTQESFNLGTVWVFDVYHLPWGCSVWPGIWTSGANWPDDGEIDIVEGVNKMTANQMALHTLPGCTAAANSGQTGTPGGTDCSPTSGCTVLETQPKSYGPDFQANGGGVWATQFDTTGVSIWFWPRDKVPASITSTTSSIDTSEWGTPSAAYPSSSCDMTKYFGPQKLIIDITLCGDWGSVPSIYDQTCGDTPQVPVTNPPTPDNQRCYLSNVINNGTADYSMAYFELGAIRAYAANASAVNTVTPGATITSSGAGAAAPTGGSATVTGAGANTTGSAGTGHTGTNGATLVTPAVLASFTAVLTLLISAILF